MSKALIRHASQSVLDLSDDFSCYTPNPTSIQKQIADLAGRVDKLLAVNECLLSKIDHKNKKAFPNGTDYWNFQRTDDSYTNPPFWPKPPGSVYIGFTGGLSRGKTDLPLLEKLFAAFPQATFLSVGFADDPSLPEYINSFPNARFIPSVPYHDLPNVVKSFDVSIIPHQINKRTQGNDLLKFMDYLACGVPVVATPCSGLDRYAHVVDLGSTPEEFIARLRCALARSGKHDPEAGRRLALSRSWEARVGDLASWLQP